MRNGSSPLQHFAAKFICCATLALLAWSARADQFAGGVVFHDRNLNGVRDPGEPGIAGVRVSNQRDIVKTDSRGRWRLPVTDDSILFVIKPRGWATPVDARQLPRFYYIHKPQGSPPARIGGVKPTGPLPASVDFPLRKQAEPDTFKAVFFADTQTRNEREVQHMAHDVVEELIGTDARFGVTLGDIVFDDLRMFDPLNATIALIGIPWFNVIGNHDINKDAPNDRLSDETFESVYGPSYYSFDYGPVHFVVLDNVIWGGKKPAGTGEYTAGLGKQQLAWLKSDLSLVPKKQLVVLLMHIPLTSMGDRHEIYRLIEKRPYTLSLAGHTHWQEHKFIGREDGWRGLEPHHHVINVTVSGSWWRGAPDERGIPHALSRDGTPNGYSIITFTKDKPVIDFKAARAPADYQMNIHAPETVEALLATNHHVYVNFFTGSIRSRVEMRMSNRDDWTALKHVTEADPYFLETKGRETSQPPERPFLPLAEPVKSSHLWKAPLPAGLQPGIHTICIRATDHHGRVFLDNRVITVR